MKASFRTLLVSMQCALLAGCTAVPSRTQPPAEVRDITPQPPGAGSDSQAENPVGSAYDLPQTPAGPTLPTIYFTSGGTRLDAPARTTIKRIADRLNGADLFARNVIINGFSDSSGEHEANVALSRERAETVARALVLNGVARERMSLRGLGERRGPAARESDDQERAEDRRVEINVLPGGAIAQ